MSTRCQVTWEWSSQRLRHPWSPRRRRTLHRRGLDVIHDDYNDTESDHDTAQCQKKPTRRKEGFTDGRVWWLVSAFHTRPHVSKAFHCVPRFSPIRHHIHHCQSEHSTSRDKLRNWPQRHKNDDNGSHAHDVKQILNHDAGHVLRWLSDASDARRSLICRFRSRWTRWRRLIRHQRACTSGAPDPEASLARQLESHRKHKSSSPRSDGDAILSPRHSATFLRDLEAHACHINKSKHPFERKLSRQHVLHLTKSVLCDDCCDCRDVATALTKTARIGKRDTGAQSHDQRDSKRQPTTKTTQQPTANTHTTHTPHTHANQHTNKLQATKYNHNHNQNQPTTTNHTHKQQVQVPDDA